MFINENPDRKKNCWDNIDGTQYSDKSNPAKQLRDNIDHSFTCKVICNASNRKFARKILEACFIATMKPSINDKIDSDLLHLDRNGIT